MCASPSSVGRLGARAWLAHGCFWWLLSGCGSASPEPKPEPEPNTEAGTEPASEAGTEPETATAALTRQQLMDPTQCQGCHPQHYREWSSSMHAYAAEDPVFVAMNQRGQRETKGKLGDLCVRCHAPMALREGATTDGLNLDDVPAKLKGVTCYVCHNAVDVGDHFNNGLKLADDKVLRGAIDNPVKSGAHAVGYGAHQDSNRAESSALCGSCHDVVVPSGVHLERTFEEYSESLFAMEGFGFETCGGCHMPGREGPAANVANAPERTLHEHLWPGVDTALTPFPHRDAQRLAIECALASNTRISEVDHDGLGGFTVQLETSAGHRQPSGSSQDRRMWVEVVAYDASDEVIFESGHIADDEVADKAAGDEGFDPQLAMFRDWTYDADGEPTHNFWEVAPSAAHPLGYESLTLPFTIDAGVRHTLSARYMVARHAEIARMTLRLRIRPIGLDVLLDLIDSGDLDEKFLDEVPTFTLHGAAVEWRPEERFPRSLLPDDLDCPNGYRALLEGDAKP